MEYYILHLHSIGNTCSCKLPSGILSQRQVLAVRLQSAMPFTHSVVLMICVFAEVFASSMPWPFNGAGISTYLLSIICFWKVWGCNSTMWGCCRGLWPNQGVVVWH